MQGGEKGTSPPILPLSTPACIVKQVQSSRRLHFTFSNGYMADGILVVGRDGSGAVRIDTALDLWPIMAPCSSHVVPQTRHLSDRRDAQSFYLREPSLS
jgi:hypothetical protein